MLTDIEIRIATAADVEAIAALLTELNFSEGYDVIAHAEAITKALFGMHHEVKLHALVAMAHHTVIGVAIYYAGYDTLSATYGYHLADIIVTKEKRGHGIGRLLMKALAKLTLEAGKEWVSLTALEGNEGAQEFYKALGMTKVNVNFYAAGKQALRRI